MDDPVGHHNGSRHMVRRHIGETGTEGREEPRSVVLGVRPATVDEARLDIAELGQILREGRLGPGRLGGPVADRLAAALVDDDRHDVLQPLPVLAHERRIGQCQEHEREGQGPERGAAASGQEAERHDRQRHNRQDPQDRDRQ